jgi:hypothetical protein
VRGRYSASPSAKCRKSVDRNVVLLRQVRDDPIRGGIQLRRDDRQLLIGVEEILHGYAEPVCERVVVEVAAEVGPHLPSHDEKVHPGLRSELVARPTLRSARHRRDRCWDSKDERTLPPTGALQTIAR